MMYFSIYRKELRDTLIFIALVFTFFSRDCLGQGVQQSSDLGQADIEKLDIYGFSASMDLHEVFALVNRTNGASASYRNGDGFSTFGFLNLGQQKAARLSDVRKIEDQFGFVSLQVVFPTSFQKNVEIDFDFCRSNYGDYAIYKMSSDMGALDSSWNIHQSLISRLDEKFPAPTLSSPYFHFYGKMNFVPSMFRGTEQASHYENLSEPYMNVYHGMNDGYQSGKFDVIVEDQPNRIPCEDRKIQSAKEKDQIKPDF